jgi:hypothetical protein
MWAFANAANTGAATNGLLTISASTSTTKVVFTGTHNGKGMVGALSLGAGTGNTGAGGIGKTIANIAGNNLLNDANVLPMSWMNDVFVREIRSPKGGVMQFKGLEQTTAND